MGACVGAGHRTFLDLGYGGTAKSFLVLYGIALSAGILTVLFSVQGLLKRLKAPKEINQVFTLAAAFLAGIGISIFGGSMMLQQLSSDDPQVLSVVQPDGGIVEYPIYDDPVLLRLEDLQDTPDAYYSRVSEEKTSLLFRVAWGLQQGMDSQGRKQVGDVLLHFRDRLAPIAAVLPGESAGSGRICSARPAVGAIFSSPMGAAFLIPAL